MLTNVPFKIMDRTFVAIMTSTPLILGVPSGSPLKSMKDVEAEVKKDPGQFTWTSVGGAGGMDINTRLFFKAIGVDILKTRSIKSRWRSSGGPRGGGKCEDGFQYRHLILA